MNEDKILEILFKTKGSQNRVIDLSNLILNEITESLQNMTDEWNLSVFMRQDNKISIFEMNDIWGALEHLEKQGKIKLNKY